MLGIQMPRPAKKDNKNNGIDRALIARVLRSEEDLKAGNVLTMAASSRRINALVRSVLNAEMEHFEGKGHTIEEARARAIRAIRRGK